MMRTHTCGELTAEHIGQAVTLCGWVQNYRDHRGLVFIDLRDREGITQVVFNLSHDDEMQAVARGLRAEDVIQVEGEVVSRSENTNPKLATGEIELTARRLEVLNKSRTPPFEPAAVELPNEELRLTHRFIDLRRDPLQRNMLLRHRLTRTVRDYFDRLGFLDIETPILGKSTPEGARDYLVPSRINPGSFYALPQSPQIYKQLLMIAGYDRYMQIARCFRDEDLRADRQPEFTQVDVEMSFIDRDDILDTIDGLVAVLMKELRDETVELPLPRLLHAEAMERFGSENPDLRFGMELVDIGEIAAVCDFGVFSSTCENGGRPGICTRFADRQVLFRRTPTGDHRGDGRGTGRPAAVRRRHRPRHVRRTRGITPPTRSRTRTL